MILQDINPWRKLGEEYIASFCTISYNCMWDYNYLKIKG